MNLNDLRSLVTLLGLALFVALTVWTWRPARRAAHDEAARLLFADEADGADEADLPPIDRAGEGAPR